MRQLLREGQADEGLSAVSEALTLINRTGERSYEAELYRLKGELTLEQSSVPGLESRVQRSLYCLDCRLRDSRLWTSLEVKLDAEFPQLLGIDSARCLGHQTDGFGGLGKSDHLS